MPNPNNSFSISQLLRTAHVKRWQIVRVAREQNIAEHMYRVWLITGHMLYKVTPEPSGPEPLCLMEIHRAAILQWALVHDQPEVITGDLASPVKRAMRKAVPDQDPVHHIELTLDYNYRSTYEFLKKRCPEGLMVVKLADMLEAIDFLHTEGLGDHAKEQTRALTARLGQMAGQAVGQFPQYEWVKAVGETILEMAQVQASV